MLAGNEKLKYKCTRRRKIKLGKVVEVETKWRKN